MIAICLQECLFITPEGGFSPPDRALGPWFKTTGFQPYSLSAGGSVRQFFMPPAFSWWLFTCSPKFHPETRIVWLICPCGLSYDTETAVSSLCVSTRKRSFVLPQCPRIQRFIHITGEENCDADRVIEYFEMIIGAYSQAPRIILFLDNARYFKVKIVSEWLEEYSKLHIKFFRLCTKFEFDRMILAFHQRKVGQKYRISLYVVGFYF